MKTQRDDVDGIPLVTHELRRVMGKTTRRPVRIQRSRARGWRMPENTLYVGRNSILGNPWVGQDAIAAYKLFLEQVVKGSPDVSAIEGALRVTRTFDKPIVYWGELQFELIRYAKNPSDVACWCGLDKACHGDLIVALPYLFAWNRAGRLV